MSRTKPRLGMPRRLHGRARQTGGPGAEIAFKAATRTREVDR